MNQTLGDCQQSPLTGYSSGSSPETLQSLSDSRNEGITRYNRREDGAAPHSAPEGSTASKGHNVKGNCQ